MENKTWIEELRREQIRNSARNPGLAAMMSFFVMGLGQIYAGHVDRGIFLLAIYIGGVFSALSLYFKGIVYQALIPIIGLKLMVISAYITSVIIILLWIYNIKDAYQLSLFSSYRDWFEVERVLLPILENHQNKLLEHQMPTNEFLIDEGAIPKQVNTKNDIKVEPTITQNEEIEEPEIILPSQEKTDGISTEKSSSIKDKATSKDENVIYFSDLDYAMSTPKQSWKIYIGFLMIFLLVGSWFQKEKQKNENLDTTSIFAISADLPTANSISKINIDVDLKVPKAKPTPSPTPSPLSNQVSEPQLTAKDSLNKGLALLNNGLTKKATEQFKLALLVVKPSQEKWKKILHSFYKVENKFEYEKYLKMYLEKFAKDYQEWQNLGKLLYDRKDYSNASKAFLSALKIKPDSIRANFLIGSIYNDLKLFQDALKYLNKALESDPLNIEVNRELATSLQETKQNAKAFEHIKRILTMQPDDEDALIKASKLSMQLSSNTSSTTKLGNKKGIIFVQGKKVPVLIKKDNKIHSPIIISNKIVSQKDVFPGVEIVNATSSSSKIITESLTALLYTAPKHIVKKASPSELPKKTSKIAQINTVSLKEMTKISDNKKQNKKTLSKKTSQKKKFKLSRNAGISELELTSALKTTSSKRLRDAVAIESSSSHEPNYNDLLQQGFSKYSQGKLEESLTLYLEYLKKKKNANAYDMVGIIFNKLGMKKDAFDASQHAYKMGYKGFSTLSRLGNLAIRINNFQDAEFYLYSALQKKPNRVDIRILYARSLAKNGKKQQAIKELHNILKTRHDSYAISQKVKSEIIEINSLK